MVCGFARASQDRTSPRGYALGAALAQRGHKVHILVSPYDNLADSGKCFEEEGVRVRNLKIGSASALHLLPVPLQFVREVDRLRPDVVHIFKPNGLSGAAAVILQTLKHYPIVVDCDDWEGTGGWNDILPHSWIVRRLIDWQERWIPTHSKAVTINSRALWDRYKTEFGLGDEKIFYIPNGPHAALQQFREPSSEEKARIR